ncbi:Zn-ribbon domain-containing OB-fold protein [Bacillus sp. FJAT-45350]|uniref:Zn-ribbon domain-containing OB-fold protein n=1 Tax=Bacillus sp. FJAT-45350 TaxID=2011014 RepID=UPI000BB95542|nr:OB-fold domain-containing protein [Bacillus sp. FJAT-45350]
MEMRVLTCTSCGKKMIPTKYTCPACLSNELTESVIDGHGLVYSHTTVSIAPDPFSKDVPYQVILVELENGLRVTGRLLESTVKIGDSVELKELRDSVYWFNLLKVVL